MVDDHPEVLDIVTRYLERRGYSVVTADGPFGVTTLVKRHSPAVVVLDVMMPALSGEDLGRLLRRSIGDVPIVFYSAIDEDEGSRLESEIPASSFVSKALGVGALHVEVDRICQRSLSPPPT